MRARVPPSRWTGLGLLAAASLMVGCAEDPAPDDELQPAHAPDIPEIAPASEVLSGAYIPTLDPMRMNAAEIRKAIGDGPRCEFSYTSYGEPVLAVQATPDGAAAPGVVKLNGDLVVLQSSTTEGALALEAEPIRITVFPDPAGQDDSASRREASMIFEISDSLRVGYGGYYSCVE